MSTAAATPALGKTFMRGLWQDNPVFVMLLGMCPTLAVTNTVFNALAMGCATLFVLVMSTVIASALRHYIPKQVRIATYIVIIATFVTIVDYTIQAISLQLYLTLGAFIQLIVVNCIILGRVEAFATKNTPLTAAADALGMGIGFTIALVCLGGVRELLGQGTLLEFPVLGSHFQPWSVMLLPPGGFFVLGGWLLVFAWYNDRQRKRAAPKPGAAQEAASHGI